MKFTQILKDTIWLLLTEGRVSYRRLKIEFAFGCKQKSVESLRRSAIGCYAGVKGRANLGRFRTREGHR